MAHSKDTLYYDGACGLCRRSTRMLRTLDWLGRLEFQDFTRVDEQDLPTTIDMALQGIPMRTREGDVLVGYAAMRRALAQTPLGFFPALLTYVPGVSHLGAWAYRWVATNRRRDACEAPPSRARSEA